MTNIYVFYKGNSAPSGWTRTTAYDGRYPAYTNSTGNHGVTGGASSHTHTLSGYTVGNSTTVTWVSSTTTAYMSPHTGHTVSLTTIASDNNDPLYYTLTLIYREYTNWESGVKVFPQNVVVNSVKGAISHADFDRESSLDGRLVKLGDYGTTGGRSTSSGHACTFTLDSYTPASMNGRSISSSARGSIRATHSHTGSANADAKTVLPLRIQTRYYTTNKTTTGIPTGIVCFFDGAPSAIWTAFNWSSYFMMGGDVDAVGLGSSSHTHGAMSFTSTSYTDGAYDYGGTGTITCCAHVHNHAVTGVTLSNGNHTPLYVLLCPYYLNTAIVPQQTLTKTYSFDILMKRIGTKGSSHDIVLKKLNIQKGVDSDILLKKKDIQKTVSSDLLLRKTMAPKTIAQDILLKKALTLGSSQDILIKKLNIIDQITSDLLLQKTMPPETFTEDLLLKKTMAPKTISQDMLLRKALTEGLPQDILIKLVAKGEAFFDLIMRKTKSKTYQNSLRLRSSSNYLDYMAKIAIKDSFKEDYLGDIFIRDTLSFDYNDNIMLCKALTNNYINDILLEKDLLKGYYHDIYIQDIMNYNFTNNLMLQKMIGAEYYSSIKLKGPIKFGYSMGIKTKSSSRKLIRFTYASKKLGLKSQRAFTILLTDKPRLSRFKYYPPTILKPKPKPDLKDEHFDPSEKKGSQHIRPAPKQPKLADIETKSDFDRTDVYNGPNKIFIYPPEKDNISAPESTKDPNFDPSEKKGARIVNKEYYYTI